MAKVHKREGEIVVKVKNKKRSPFLQFFLLRESTFAPFARPLGAHAPKSLANPNKPFIGQNVGEEK